MCASIRVRVPISQVRQRIAKVLLHLRSQNGELDGNAALPPLRGDLADLSGTEVETLVRHLRNFKDEGILDIPNSCQHFYSVVELHVLTFEMKIKAKFRGALNP